MKRGFPLLWRGKCTTFDIHAYASLVRRCSELGDLEGGRRTHQEIAASEQANDRFLLNLLVDMYGRCGSVGEARQTFDSMRRRNVFSWTIMIAAYTHNGHLQEALDLFQEMLSSSVEPNQVTFLWLVQACTLLGDVVQGRQVHKYICRTGISLPTGNALVSMYAKLGCFEEARTVLLQLRERDVVSWTSIIAAYADKGDCRMAMNFYLHMLQDGVKPGNVTFISLLRSDIRQYWLRSMLEEHMLESCIDYHPALAAAIIEMNVRVGQIAKARSLFSKLQKDVVAWSSVISTLTQHGHPKEALEVYHEMDKLGLVPTGVTLLNALGAVASLGDTVEGKLVHDRVIEAGLEQDLVLGTALVNMYGKCGCIEEAKLAFDKVVNKDLVLWNTMMAAYASQGHCKEVLLLYKQVALHGFEPDDCTYSCVVDACAAEAELEEGRKVHARLGHKTSSKNIVTAALVNLYTKCGCLDEASRAFELLEAPDVVSWSTIVAAFARAGDPKQSVDFYRKMQLVGAQPDSVTYLNILCGCCHAGLLDQAKDYFSSMVKDYGISPTAEHCACMVDLFGRCGRLEDAEKIIHFKMPVDSAGGSTEHVACRALLASCRVHGDFQRGEDVAKVVCDAGGESGPYVTLSNMYAQFK